jgi:hypothetical protein
LILLLKNKNQKIAAFGSSYTVKFLLINAAPTNRWRLFHKKLMVACLKFVMPWLMNFSQLTRGQSFQE